MKFKYGMISKHLVLALVLLAASHSFCGTKMEVGATDIYIKSGLLFLQTGKFNQQDYDNAEQDYGGSLPSLVAGMETALWDDIVIGGYLGFSKFHSDVRIPTSAEHYIGDITAYSVFVTAKYFWPVTYMKFSPYIHADALGVTAYSERRQVTPKTAFSLNEPSTDITENYGIYAGSTYPLTEKIGVFGELGYGYTVLNLGLSYRIK